LPGRAQVGRCAANDDRSDHSQDEEGRGEEPGRSPLMTCGAPSVG
jgi:hypothetical protein